jgi:hypothetical protein
MIVAAATLCAPAFATVALAAIGATGGGGHPAMGSLAGTQGLRGTTTPEASAPAPATSSERTAQHGATVKPSDASNPPPPVHAQRNPAPKVPARAPTHHRSPAPPHVTPTPHTHVNPPSTPVYDPTQPGAPTSSGTTSGSGTTTSGTGSTTGSGSSGGSGGTSDGYNAYSGGG